MLAREQNPTALPRVCEEAPDTSQASASLERSARELARQLERLAHAHAHGSPDELPLAGVSSISAQPPPARRGALARLLALAFAAAGRRAGHAIEATAEGEVGADAGVRWWQTKNLRLVCGAAAVASGTAALVGVGSLVLLKLNFHR